jgi:antitoxin (DNA-binding transcriptional repressor) of toxin-antitoxin stability system
MSEDRPDAGMQFPFGEPPGDGHSAPLFAPAPDSGILPQGRSWTETAPVRTPVIKMNVKEAEGHLDQLIEEAAAGQDVVITGNEGLTVRLVPLSEEERETRRSSKHAEPPKRVGHALDRFIGTWSAEQEAEILKAVEVFERVDESFWQ